MSTATLPERISAKLYIQHQEDPECRIVGTLEQLQPNAPTQGRKIALILHGTMGHKDYLYQKRLALKLPMDSFRFDFRGNHETGGQWKPAALLEDIEDIKTVVAYLKSTYGYVIDLVVAHSRGVLSAFKWICTTEDGRNISGFVNASGRYRMHVMNEAAWGGKEGFGEQGFCEWSVVVARKPVTVKIYREDIDIFRKWDTSFVIDQFPSTIDVLTIHGLSDTRVPPFDALIYASILGQRTPGTHTLHVIEDADHNFTNRQDDVVNKILDWLDVRQRNGTINPIWVNTSELMGGRVETSRL
ncbi:alpha/beta-hydrolase [Pluteus cervinus]|uniref:Alpha/beta-hydrolase n=1 Tax=Pluteus cervinus TaxID=181527 RepID=A0ACD3B6A9_9AGAR|nr:alpha/beta-hydrolase [Pluteus cervinus]